METQKPAFPRINSLDAVRGMVMVIMALDHVRDLLHVGSLTDDPTNLDTTTAALFLTRWVTHICAPTFVFLSGASAYLSLQRNQDIRAGRRFLISRGIWLLVLEFTVVNFGIWFDMRFSILLFEVIAAIGLGFIVLGLLLSVRPATLGIIGIAVICLHNLYPFFPLSAPGVIPIGQGTTLVIGYPPIPWIALLLTGYCCGGFFMQSLSDRKRWFLFIGVACLAVFTLLRWINLYGDPQPWTPQATGLFTFLSFINVTKYPPSLLFDLLFLGLMFLFLFAAERLEGRVSSVFTTYGRVPLFYFLLHFYIIHTILFIVLFLQGYSPSEFEFGSRFGRPQGDNGLKLWVIYLVWIGVVLVLYPICKWYGRYKAHNQGNIRWLRFL
ncbi:DUF1624 domain-containing protein [Parapedobacter koreensis]|uniref:Uncharacterized membrane protein n=1 Tax=Parapedobacter koreensis TaxID=332977 RepID=A0A1H7MK79_9SPHI|nr:heparan-alpha-glucosaminide N-acetyltransferase domain-containing protein [Parapedobacter koreensis]SEL11085.1 Uncharacterized membrane protein [Parapedobacter koreensis]